MNLSKICKKSKLLLLSSASIGSQCRIARHACFSVNISFPVTFNATLIYVAAHRHYMSSFYVGEEFADHET